MRKALLLAYLFAAIPTWAAADTPTLCQGSPHTSAHALAYDPERRLVVSFGGVDVSGRVTADLWGWNGEAWICVASSGSSGPSPRTAAIIAYDVGRRVLVLYGGRGRNGSLTDTWELGDSGWSLKSEAGPTDLPHGALAYDAASGGVLMYHGVVEDAPQRKTWLWNGAAWSEQAVGPDRQYPNAMMPSETGRRAMLMTARPSEAGSFEGTLYAWDGEGWDGVLVRGGHPVFSPQAPVARNADQVLLFAGFEASREVTTWIFNGQVWRRYAGVSPTRRKGAQMAFDNRRSVIVIHGGDDGSQVLNDTWEWDGSKWRQASP